MNEEIIHKGPILLVSCYELGHQPAGIAMPLGFLRRAGYECEAMDVSVGQKVLFQKYAGTEFKLDEEELLILSQKDVLAVIE